MSHENCRMLFTKEVFLGHIISQTRIEVITNILIPKTPKEVRLFLGHVGYYRWFIDNFTKIVAPLFKLITKDVEFKRHDQCLSSFETLKLKFSATLVLRGPNWSIPFHMSIDASNTTLGIVLWKKDNQTYYANYFVSKNLRPTKLNYTFIENYFLSVVHAINKFRHYITRYEVCIHTNHFAILFFMNNSITNGRITRWMLLLH